MYGVYMIDIRRLGGSLAAALWSTQAGADIVRVHDVSEAVQAMKVWGSIENGYA